ncbi:MAG: hypothetical protein QOJ35_4039 [Solirubrobacteraceae bacterium]|jgi:hypothetical protein|nr:hypothetical protein [Solirubrobacteraceae bacterium]
MRRHGSSRRPPPFTDASRSAWGRPQRAAVLATALAGALLTASPAGAFTIGQGSRPGLAVDAAGTAYVAWNGTEVTNATLRFCRLPRGAAACAAGVAGTLPATATSTSLSRPFVVVSGDRVVVVQYRYPTTGDFKAGTYRYTSTNRGASFGPEELVGSVGFEEAVPGPGDTLSGLPINAAMTFQNVMLSGAAPVNPDGTSAVPGALLSSTHLNYGTVGLIDAATPLAVYTNGDSAEFRRYAGSGSLNDVANWTAPVGLGTATYPKLAGGPSGLVLLAGDGNMSLFARKWNGSTFGPPVTIGPGSTPYKHLFQDAAGQLHAVFQRDSANPLQVVHAVSDDGLTWRSNTVATQDIATAGGIADLRVATAPDHVGVTVWHGGLGAGDIRLATVGPVALPKPKVTASGSARRVGGLVRIRVTGKLARPLGITEATGCKGKAQVSVRRGVTIVSSKTVSITSRCGYTFNATVKATKVKRSKRLLLRIRFRGNAALAPVTKLGSIAVR